VGSSGGGRNVGLGGREGFPLGEGRNMWAIFFRLFFSVNRKGFWGIFLRWTSRSRCTRGDAAERKIIKF